MKYFKKDSNISELKLSNRAYNALNRANIKKIGMLCDLTEYELSLIKNLGKKSIKELSNIIADITIVNEVPNEQDQINDIAIKTFVGNDGYIYRDIELTKLQLSSRSINCLAKNYLLYYSQIHNMMEKDMLAIKSMGPKSRHEVLDKIKIYRPERVSISGLYESKEQRVCRKITRELAEEFNIPSIYDKLYNLTRTISVKDNEDSLYKHLTDMLYGLDEIRESLKQYIIKKIECRDNGVSGITLFDQLPFCLKKRELFQACLEKMKQQRLIQINKDGLYEIRYQTVMEYASSIEDDRASGILIMRLNGSTLEEAGNKYGLTRERVRQIESKYIKRSPYLMEDKYGYIFKQYQISKSDFVYGFGENEQTYNYLSIAYERGNRTLSDILDDEKISNKYKKCVERVIYKNYVMLNGERVLRSRSQLSEYVLRTVGKEGITFGEFKELYFMLLEDLGLQDDPQFTLIDRGYENKMAASSHVLWKQHKKMRYYNLDAYDYTELYRKLRLESYQNIEISTLKLFNENPDLMNEYDIQDEYELHNLLKKTCTVQRDIQFKRMPNIEFGKANRDKQVMNLLVELAPINSVDFAKAYENEYGVLSRTVSANYLKSIDKYFFDGKYRIDAPRMSDLMINVFKGKLIKDFYLLSEIKRIYDRTFPDADPQMLNPFTIKSLGYKVYTNYAISNSYSSAVDYFRAILTNDDLVDASMFPEGVLTIVSYMSEVYRLKSYYEIIEYKPQKYINIRRLQSVYCGIDTLKDYCEKVYLSKVSPFFTVYSLQKKGFTHEIDDLGFDEWFYSSILVEDKEHFTYRRIGGNRIFRKGKSEFLLIDFLEWIIYSIDSLSINIYDLTEYLLNEYNISLNTFKIVETVSGSSLYYDKITEKIYADYEVYFAEI